MAPLPPLLPPLTAIPTPAPTAPPSVVELPRPAVPPQVRKRSPFGLERAPALLQGRGRERAPLLSALPMERQLCAGNRDDLGNLQGAGMWQPRDPRSAPAGASPLRPSQHCCRYGPRQHCSFHRPPAAPCLLFSMHEGYASRQTAPFVGCALQMPNGSPDHTASSLWLRPRSVSPAIPFASKAASHSSAAKDSGHSKTMDIKLGAAGVLLGRDRERLELRWTSFAAPLARARRGSVYLGG